MTTRQQRHKFQRLHSHYQRLAYRLVIKQMRAIFKGIPLSNITYDTALATIALNVNEDSVTELLYKVYLEVGLKYGRISNAEINKIVQQKADVPYPLFSEEFQSFMLAYLRNPKKGGIKIESINKTLTKSVMQVVSDAQKQGLTNAQMAKKVQDVVNKPNFYRYKALRIVRTETSFAMNVSREVSFEESTIKMRKIWISGGAAEPRMEHLMMDGVQADENGIFTLPSGHRCKYPTDADLPPEEVISCTCSYSYEPVRDSNGDLIFK